MRIDEIVSPEITRNLEMYNYELVDATEIGPYGLFLTKMNSSEAEELLGTSYQLAINKNGTNFADYSVQMQKFVDKGETIQHSLMKQFDAQIKSWISKYGILAVGSENPRKTDFYRRLLQKRGFKVQVKTAHRRLFLQVSI